jgi:uncharacterized repeat protein (TIGR01451 family)
MEGRRMKVLLRMVVALCTGAWVLAFALSSGTAAAATTGNDSCSYPSSSFTESTVMRWAQVNGTGSSAQIVAYGNDEKGLLLGVNGATPMSSATQNGSNGQTGGASYHVSNATGGSTTATDPSGRPYYPALYITDLTNHPLTANGTGVGDYQNGGTPRNLSGGHPFIDDVFGTWSTATVSGSTYTVTPPLDKNDWNLGQGSDAPVGTTFAAMGDEGFGAEVRWNASHLTDSDGNAIQPGDTYRIQIIEHDGDQNKTGGDAGEFCVSLTIPGKKTVGLTTNASSTTIGGTIQDQATLSGGSNPTGTLTWKLYGPSDSTCSAAPIRTSTVTVNGDGTYTSPSFTPTSTGFYRWIASYSGDGNNLSTSGSCNDPNETSTVHHASPKLATSASSATVGGTIQDAAILSGGVNPTGTITWNLYGPGDTSCSTSIQTFSKSVNGNGTYLSPTFTANNAGTYRWIASYSGDGNNLSAAGACNDPNEQSTVTKISPQLRTSATSGTVGDSIHDVATLSGGVNPTGTITWNLYAPGDSSCSTSIQTFSQNVNGNGAYTSPGFVTTSAGSYRWIASYSGDGNNLTAAGACNDPGETSIVNKDTPTLTTDAVSATAGQPIHDVAHLTGGHNPTGTISWNVYASSDSGCTSPLNSSAISVAVHGDGDYTSPNYTPAGVGSYEWVATYSGDGNNVSLATACADPNEVSTVTQNAAPAITLHKVERIGSGSFTHGPVTGNVGETVDYQMRVTNTGNTTLVIAFTDDQCDSGTLSGPSVLSGSYDASTRTLSAGGELLYTCSHVLAAGDQPYTNTASVIGTPPAGPPVSATDSVKAFANTPGIRVIKLQRDGTSGAFTSNPITASVGDTVYYEIQATNTGNVPLTLSLSDPHCDAGTIQGPFSVSGTLNGDVLSPGGVAQYTCWHVVTANDQPQFTNTAVVTGTPPSGPPVHGTGIVVANITKSAIQVLKLEKIAGSGDGFTTGPLTVTEHKGHYVVKTIDYEIQVTNTGNTPLTLSLDDPRCDAGTIQGPAVITGTLSGKVLSPGGQAQYTCSHRYVQGDSPTFVNTATVTGTPPSGPPVHGTSHVTVERKFVSPKTKLCRSLRTGKPIHYRGHRKPKACRPQRGNPGKGFTG